METRDVVDPAGVHWRVRRRWYPWRRALSFRDALSTTPDEAPSTDPEAQVDAAAPTASEGTGGSERTKDPDVPRNLVLRVLFYALGLVLWIVVGVAKLVFYVGVVALFVVISLLELVLELLVMPFVLLLRLVVEARWPVEITRQGKHFATKHASDLAEAANLRDELAQQLEGGTPLDERTSAA